MNTKNLFKILESVGAITLVFVLLGIQAVLQNRLAVAEIDRSSGVWVIIFCSLIGVSIIVALLHIAGRIKTGFRRAFGCLLIFFGSVVMVSLPQYLHTMLSLPVGFWYKVSIFSLPAICIDGGLFTLFSELQDSKEGLSPRESSLLGFGFCLYTISAVTINFVVLLGKWPVEHQINFYRMLIFFTLLLFATVSYRKSRAFL